MKKIISLGLACALAVSPLSCNFAFANESVAESEVSTTNNENSKSKVAEETLKELAEKFKKAKKEKLEILEKLETIWKWGIGLSFFSSFLTLTCGFLSKKYLGLEIFAFGLGMGLNLMNITISFLVPFTSN